MDWVVYKDGDETTSMLAWTGDNAMINTVPAETIHLYVHQSLARTVQRKIYAATKEKVLRMQVEMDKKDKVPMTTNPYCTNEAHVPQ